MGMTPPPEPTGDAQDGPGWGVVMALHVLGRVPWDLFRVLCKAAEYHSVPMGFFEESWEGRDLADGKEAYTLMRGGKAAGYVELNDGGHRWIASRSRAARLQVAAVRLPKLLEAAADWRPKTA